jgi:hypothetical protein
MTTSDTPPGTPSTPPARPVTAAEISAFPHHLTQLRSPAHTYDQADHTERAAVLAHKAELFDRIADQHTGPDHAHARQIAQHARAAAAEETTRLHLTSPAQTP